MPQRTLMIVLGLCAAIGLWPVVAWLLAFAVDSMDDGWLGPLAVTIPIGMGLGALALAWHGLLLQRELVDSLEEDFAQSLDDFVAAGLGRQAPAGAAATSVAARPATGRARATAVSTASAGNGAATEAKVAGEEAGGAGGGKVAEAGSKAKDAATKAGKQAGARVVRRAKSRTKNAARRGLRDLFRDVTPKF